MGRPGDYLSQNRMSRMDAEQFAAQALPDFEIKQYQAADSWINESGSIYNE